MSAALDRLNSGYYNSDPVSAANPGGFGAGGHEVNWPAALADIGEVCAIAASGAQLIAMAEGTAFEAESALQQVNGLVAAAKAAAATAVGVAGFDPKTFTDRFAADEARLASLEGSRSLAAARALAVALTL